MNRFLPLVLIVPALACASAQAKTMVDVPTLEVPPVPARLIGPSPVAQPPATEPVVEAPPVSAPPANRIRPVRDANRAEPKPEPKPEVPPDGGTVMPLPAPVGPLRISGTADGPEAERQVREILGRAIKLLDTVDRDGLSESRKTEYDGARTFIKQAEDNMKTAKWVVAMSAAGRAEDLAILLGGRNLP